MPTEPDELAVLLRQLDGEAWTRRVRRSDPQLGGLVKGLSASAQSLAAAISELREPPAEASLRAHYVETLRRARQLAATVTAQPLEEELAEILRLAGLDNRQHQIVARRLGWDGQGGTTLEAAASGSMSRERVRQLEERVARYVIDAKPWLPVVEAALELLVESSPISSDDAAELLRSEKLADATFDPFGVVTAARMAGLGPRPIAVGQALYMGKQAQEAIVVVDAARKVVSRAGAASLGAILDYLGHSSFNHDQIRRILSIDSETRWLDSERNWLFLPTPKNRAANHLRKMLAVTPSLSLTEVREGMRRYRGRDVNLPSVVLLALCECFGWVRVVGDRVLAAEPLDYREVLENTEETLVDIFRKHGPVLDRATAVDLGEQFGLDRTTTGLYLGWSPIIERLVVNRYTLRGAEVPAGTLEAMRSATPRVRVQRGYGWMSTGRLWVGYVLSQPAIDSGVVGVPSALKLELEGRYALAPPIEELGEVATDGTNLWGLYRIFRHYAAEAGDALVLEFDVGARLVYAFVGGEELLDPENRPAQIVVADPEPVTELTEVSVDGVPSVGAETTKSDAEWDLPPPRRTVLEETTLGTLEASEGNNSRASEGTQAGEVRQSTAKPEAGNDREDVEAPTGSTMVVDPASAESSVALDSVTQCIVPGCAAPGKHKIGVRCRVWSEPSPVPGKSRTSALWAPDSDAFLCDDHALGGAHITLIYEPNDSGETAVKVIAAPPTVERRRPIRLESPEASPPEDHSSENPHFSPSSGDETPPNSAFSEMFVHGRVYRRSELHDRLGGQRYGGISTPQEHPIVLLISGEEGAAFGYDDEELEDGTLLYFGEGQVGDMSFVRGNLAVRDHAALGKELHLFAKERSGYVQYRGQYDCVGFEWREGVRDRDDNPRRAILFRLVPREP